MKFVARIERASVQEGQPLRLNYPPYDVVLIRRGNTVHALEDACNHAGASLAEGNIKDDCILCPMHGYAFHIETGVLVRPRRLCDDQRTFVVQEEEGDALSIWDPGVIAVK